MFSRIRIILAAFERGEFSERGLAERLDQFLERSAGSSRPSRKRTEALVLWGEP